MSQPCGCPNYDPETGMRHWINCPYVQRGRIKTNYQTEQEISEALEYAKDKKELLGLHSTHVILWVLAAAYEREKALYESCQDIAAKWAHQAGENRERYEKTEETLRQVIEEGFDSCEHRDRAEKLEAERDRLQQQHLKSDC